MRFMTQYVRLVNGIAGGGRTFGGRLEEIIDSYTKSCKMGSL